LSSNEIPYIYTDNSGLFWITTQGGGVNIFNPNQKRFNNYKHKQNNPFSLSGNNVTSVFEDKDGVIWIGTWDGGLNKWDRAKNEFAHYKHIPNDPSSLSSNRVTVIYEDKSGILWVGTWNQGLNKFDRRTGKFYTYWHDPSNVKTISDNLIYSISEDKSGVLWIGTANGGLCTYDRENDCFIHFNYKSDSSNILSSTHSSSIYLVDKSGTLWISADDGGLISVNLQKNEIVHYKHQPNNLNSLSNDVVTDVYEDKSGFYWIGTSGGGLNKFDKVNGQFRCYLTKDGLPSDNITGVLEDNNGNLWITTNDGLSKFNPLSESFRNYDIKDGLSSISLTKGRKVKSGEMILGSDNGFIVFYPDSIKDNTHIPPVFITEFYLFNKPVQIGYDSLSGRTILSKSIIEIKELELNFDDNVFAFEFAALDYHAPLKNKYAYKMEGFDKDWTYTDANRNTATYTNLDPGEYTFRVKGSNNDGYWNEQGASIRIIILPPWWRTNIAYLFYILFIAGIIYFTWRMQLRRIRNKHEYEMSRFEAQKLHEVDELKSRFFTNISHEFRTPLTLILGPVKQMIEKLKEGKMKDDLGIVHRNANKLLELVNQLLDISKIESGNMKLQTVPQNIVPLVKALALSFTSYAERKKITLNFTSTEDKIVVYIDKDKIEKIITNILSNAFKFTPEGGTIEVTVRTDERNSNIIISDTGVGIPKEKISKIFDRFYQVDGSHTREQEGTGVGLSLTKELVELHKGKIEVESEEGKGTTFIVSIPLGAEHLKPEEVAEKEKAEDFEDEKLKPVYDEEIERKSSHYVELYENESLPLLLVVEDNKDVRSYIKDNLKTDYRILEAADGEDGWDKATEYIPDLIVSDVMMPKMDGFELCRKLKTDERTSHIPVILLTAKAAKEDKLQGFETGADEYLMKPFDTDELKSRIKNLIEQRKRLHEHFKGQGIIDYEKAKLTSIDKKFLQKALSIITKNISHSEFGLESFAELLNVSRSVLHRKIVSLTGESPGDLIRYIRLKKAAQLIEQKFGNITEISLEVGFNNPGQFARSFQKQFGVSPSTYSQKFARNSQK
jgi:signal transduction histidine kinase/DNA-binding response OmpR family regulator/streptogramin lyase